ncbi:tRNA pseudouridine(55) synthase TruB [Lacticaseibacillus pabuli]|uniref:tRNA pseudouridine synthase B n=1 Tax=Lacticaseibacillus pabuli TaxID=3025672 RepID=A0ABY7WUA7_9LACO|nr:tRNA pseudouridine(55) synthase TruB [Lacticaseibacillus sp. KACC 23028]WDF83747.1 tRNA pseudouridine(55) synthase TruB [Lacticaseibacillus sp. KACC 23028]
MNGFLPLYKPKGMTSADAVYKLRKMLHLKRIGHSGTLDPQVDGMLPVAMGIATKAIQVLQDGGKVYSGEVTLGFATTTEDLEGEVIERTPLSGPLPLTEIDAAMQTFIGEITQIPPMYSAVRVKGRHLYDYARAGETVERPKRTALIKSFERTTEPVFNPEDGTLRFSFLAKVGKGTYIRTLAVDLGRKLGYAACMTQLTRLASGGFTSDQAVSLDEVQNAIDNDELDALVEPLQYAYPGLPKYQMTDKDWEDIQHGRFLHLPDQGPRLILELHGVMKAIYKWNFEYSLYQPEIMYLTNEGGRR